MNSFIFKAGLCLITYISLRFLPHLHPLGDMIIFLPLVFGLASMVVCLGGRTTVKILMVISIVGWMGGVSVRRMI